MDRTVHGIAITGAYHKINYVSGNKNRVHIDVRVYKDKATSDADSNDYIESLSYVMEDADMAHDGGASDNNYTKQAYSYLKGLAEYSTAVDNV